MTQENSWQKSPFRKILFIIIIAWIALAIIFGIYDLQISAAIADANNPFGVFGADYGEVPGYAIIGLALVILIGSYIPNLKRQKIGAFILIGIAWAGFSVSFIIDSEDLFLIGGSVGILVLIFTVFTYNRDWRNYRNIARVTVLLAIILPVLFVLITKPLCGRVRPRNVLWDSGEFTPWFLPPGISSYFISDSNQSFPSGHTAMGWMLLPLLIPFRNKEAWVKILGGVLIIGWGGFVGLSRILVGAHYASDVLFSTGVGCVAIILLYKRYYLK